MKKTDLYLLLSTKTALLGAVTPSLRAVTVQFDEDENKIYLHFFYDEEISEELFDISSTASAEVQPEPGISYYTFNDNFVVQYNYPKPIPFQGGLAYLRKEKNMPLPPLNFLPRGKCIPESYLAYTTQQGLLGRVIPSLRAVIVGVNEKTKTLEFYFFYDEPITKDMRQLSLEAADVATQAFSAEYKDQYCAQMSIECLPWPDRIPHVGQRYVFERMEPKPPWAFLEEAKNNGKTL